MCAHRGQVLIPLSVIVLLQRAPNTSRPVGSNFVPAPDLGRRDYDHPLVLGPPPSPAWIWNKVFVAVVFIVVMFGVGFVSVFNCFAGTPWSPALSRAWNRVPWNTEGDQSLGSQASPSRPPVKVQLYPSFTLPIKVQIYPSRPLLKYFFTSSYRLTSCIEVNPGGR